MSRTQPPRTMLRARIKCRKSNDSTDARMTFKGSYTLPLHLQRQPKTIHGSHLAPVHGNRYGLKETSDDLARKFRPTLSPIRAILFLYPNLELPPLSEIHINTQPKAHQQKSEKLLSKNTSFYRNPSNSFIATGRRFSFDLLNQDSASF